MFYEIRKELKKIKPEDIDPDVLTVGCITSEDLVRYGRSWGISEESITASRKANPLFRTEIDVQEHYTCTELKIVNRDGQEDCVAIYIEKNFLLIVDIEDEDNSTIGSFLKALRKYSCAKITQEKLILWFMESLLSDRNTVCEELRNRLSGMEESIIRGDAGEEFHNELLELKKVILRHYNFYEQIRDISETLEENENEILDPDGLVYISNLTRRIARLSADMSELITISDHIQDSYATLLDQRMNKTMKIFTLITTIFFPLTIVVGWYGMNFRYMPELSWKYGYLYVIVLSIAVVLGLWLIGKKKKWF